VLRLQTYLAQRQLPKLGLSAAAERVLTRVLTG